MASVKDLTPFGIRLETCRRISDADYEGLVRQGCRPIQGDVLIAKDGATALDTVCEVKRNDEVVLLSSVAILRPNPSIMDSSYLRYYLDAPATRSYLKGSFISGAAIPRIVLKDLKSATVRVPPLPLQRKIAGVLSAYDELIENNQRRIRILEEVARVLYREWFVELRFPGYARVPRVSSPLGEIPKGWCVASIGDVCERVTDGSHFSPKSVDEGFPMASSKDLHDWGVTLETCRFIGRDDFDALVRNGCKPKENDVLVTKDGANYLKHIFVNRAERDLVLLSSVAILRPNSRVNAHLLAATLKWPENRERLKNYVTGAAIPRIVLKDFKRFQFVLPSTAVQTEWARIVEPLTALCWTLLDQIENLRRTRDLLLPKLLTGSAGCNHRRVQTGLTDSLTYT
jgi:type I restriction enzyme S subunit